MAKKQLFKRRKGLFGGTEKVPIKFSIDMLNSILAYSLEDSPLINRGCLSNVKKLFDLMDMRMYTDDLYSEARIHYIKQALIAKLELYMENKNLILDYCYSSKYLEVEEEMMYDIKNVKLQPAEIKYMNSMLSDRLNYCFFYLYKDKFIDLFGKLETNEFVHLKDLKENIMDIITKLISDVRRAEALEEGTTEFSLDPDLFDTVVYKTVTNLQNPSNNIKCGIQALNEMIGGAFESGRFYIFLGYRLAQVKSL